MSEKIDFAFLDSGTGGIPYMLSLKEKSPESRCVYLGDTVHFPYGEKSEEEVTLCASESIEKILDLWNPRIVVIACNTISVTALNQLRERFPDVPIVGTVPAIKLAAKVTKSAHNGRTPAPFIVLVAFAKIIADATKANEELGWKAEKNLDDMCADSWNWQSKNPNGYANDEE